MKALVLNSCLSSLRLKTSTLSAHFGTLYTANAEALSEFREEKDQIYSQWTPDLFFLSSSLCQSDEHILFCYLELHCFFFNWRIIYGVMLVKNMEHFWNLHNVLVQGPY